MWDRAEAVKYLNSHAGTLSRGHCAEYTRKAILAGGIDLAKTEHARNYGPSLRAAGFNSRGQITTGFSLGDVVVMEPPDGQGSGHMAMFNGIIWVSDFKQRDIYPGPGYRSKRPAYTVFRYPD